MLRYGGLYTLVRGATNNWLSGKIQESSSSPNGLINLIHYDDAAEVVMSVFKEASTLKADQCLIIKKYFHMHKSLGIEWQDCFQT